MTGAKGKKVRVRFPPARHILKVFCRALHASFQCQFWRCTFVALRNFSGWNATGHAHQEPDTASFSELQA